MERLELAPGAALNLLPLTKFKTNLISVSFQLPISERVASYGTLLSRIMKTSCREFPGVKELSRELDELYGAKVSAFARKTGDCYELSFSLEYLNADYGKDFADFDRVCLDMLAKILFDPAVKDGAFDRAAVEREKKNLCDLIDARINDKRLYALTRCEELAAKGQPFSVYAGGNKEIVASITPEGLYDFYREMLSSAVVEIYAFGGMKKETVLEVFNGKWAADRAPVVPVTVRLPETYAEYEERYPVEQAKLSLTFTFNGDLPDDTALTLFTILYGGSANSLLFMNVREKLSLCYYCSARLEKVKKALTVYSGVLPENIEVTKREILAQLERIKKADFSDAEFAAAQKTYVNGLRAMADSMHDMRNFYLIGRRLGGVAEPEEIIRRIGALGKADMAAVAEKVKLTTVFVLKNGEEK